MEDKEFFDLAQEYRKQYPEIQNLLRIFEAAEPYLTQINRLTQQKNSKAIVISDAGGGIYGPQKISAPFITKAESTIKQS